MNSIFTARISAIRGRLIALGSAVAVLGLAGSASAQLVNYNEQLGNYKENKDAAIKVNDTVSPGVAARARVARALAQDRLVNQDALMQPDGTLKLPSNQTNVVVRSTYNDVQRGADGVVRIASPSIQGNVTGNVTLFVDGQGVRNITVLNNPQ